MPNKVFVNFDEAVADIPDGASICMDSFAIAGTPHNLVAALRLSISRALCGVAICMPNPSTNPAHGPEAGACEG